MDRKKMPLSLRAKQFMPFAALNGFEEALRKVEKEHEEKYTLSQRDRKTKEIIDALNDVLKDEKQYLTVVFEDINGLNVLTSESSEIKILGKNVKIKSRTLDIRDIYQIKITDKSKTV